jgi:hypothetical protein
MLARRADHQPAAPVSRDLRLEERLVVAFLHHHIWQKKKHR